VSDTDPSARRPLKSRDVEFFRALARQLARMGVTPNAISFASIVCGVLAGAAFALTAHLPFPGWAMRAAFAAAAVFIQLRLLCNLIDGLVAVECGKKTPTGDIWNEAPDRFSDIAILVGTGYAAFWFGWGPELGYLAALGAVLTAYVRALGASLGAGQDFCGPGAKPQRMALCTGGAVLVAIFPQLIAWWFVVPALVTVLAAITVLRRLAHLAAYLRRTRIS
jgi:phosphatidylglycerophosphate synthase